VAPVRNLTRIWVACRPSLPRDDVVTGICPFVVFSETLDNRECSRSDQNGVEVIPVTLARMTLVHDRRLFMRKLVRRNRLWHARPRVGWPCGSGLTLSRLLRRTMRPSDPPSPESCELVALSARTKLRVGRRSADSALYGRALRCCG
jgi:hypothetical protein